MKKIVKAMVVGVLLITQISYVGSVEALNAQVGKQKFTQQLSSGFLPNKLNELTRANSYIDFADDVSQGDTLPKDKVVLDDWSGFEVAKTRNGRYEYNPSNDTYSLINEATTTSVSDWESRVYAWVRPNFVVDITKGFKFKVSLDRLIEAAGVYGDDDDPTPFPGPGIADTNGWLIFGNASANNSREYSYKSRVNSPGGQIRRFVNQFTRPTWGDTIEIGFDYATRNYQFKTCYLSQDNATSANCDAPQATSVRQASATFSLNETNIMKSADIVGIYLAEPKRYNNPTYVSGDVTIRDMRFEGYISQYSEVRIINDNTRVINGSSYDDVAKLQNAKYYFINDNASYPDKYYFQEVTSLTSTDITNQAAIKLDTAGVYDVNYSRKNQDDKIGAAQTGKITVLEKAKFQNSSKHVNLAPSTAKDLFTMLYVSGEDTDSGKIDESNFEVTNYGGYDFNNPLVGVFPIEFTINYSNGQKASFKQMLVLKDDDTVVEKETLLRAKSFYINKTAAKTLDANGAISYAKAFAKSTVDGSDISVSVDNAQLQLINSGEEKTYSLTFTSNNSDAVSKTVKVTVVDDQTVIGENYVLRAIDKTILVSEVASFDVIKSTEAKAYLKTDPTVNGTVVLDKTKSDTIEAKPGYYKIYYYVSEEPTVTKTVTVKVEGVGNGVAIAATDAQVKLASAPQTANALLLMLNTVATDDDATALTSKVKITNFGGYNLSSPVVGDYLITLEVEGRDLLKETTSAILSVKANDSSINSITLNHTTPVFVKLNSGETIEQVIDNYVKPLVIETVNDTVQTPYLVKAASLSRITKNGYDNTKSGTYYVVVETKGKQTNLNVERIIEVTVGKAITDDKVFASIDGSSIKVLNGSSYNANLAPVLHANTYASVSVELRDKTTTTTKALTSSNLLATTVNTSVNGSYTTQFYYSDNKSSATASYDVTVVSPSTTNALIESADAQVKLTKAPTTKTEILELLSVKGFESDGSDLTSKVVIIDNGGYDSSNKAVGSYLFTFALTGSDQVMVTSQATLTVVKDDAFTNSIEVYLNNPVYVKLNSGEDAATVVDKYILPHVLETTNGENVTPYIVSANELQGFTSGGYKNSEANTYYFLLTIKGKNGLVASRVATVIVEENNQNVESYATIDGRSIKVLQNSSYNQGLAAALHANNYNAVSAVVTTKGTSKSVLLTEANILASNVDITKTGTYTTSFFYQDDKLGIESVNSFNITVVASGTQNAVIEATDINVAIDDAPKTAASIKTLLRAKANDGDGSDLTSEITIIDLDDYDTSAPVYGKYHITLQVQGKDNVRVTTTAVLTIDSNTEPYNAIAMYANTPVFVTKGSGETALQVIDNYIKPQLVETLEGNLQNTYQVSAIDLERVSVNGYDNSKSGSYYFVLKTSGKHTGLEAEKIIEVIVSDTVPTDKTVVEIDGSSISVLRGSGYSKTLAPVLHANRYNYVSAEVTKGSNQTTASLTSSNVLVTNVDTSVNNTYQTTFYYQDSASGAEAIKTYNVSVEDAKTSNANIAATDTLVSLEAAPKTASEVLSTLKANAISTDGTDLTSTITIIDYDSYELAKPALGSYTITMEVLGKDGVKITTSAVLKVVENTSKKDRVELIVNNPVYIKQNDGTSALNVIDNYITPYISEVSEDILYDAYRIKSSSLDSSAFGGYDNSKLGTYYFVLKATGTKTKLQSEVIVTVIVSASGTDSLTIDGKDISVLKDSVYNNDLASKLHRNTYADVSAVWQTGPVSVTSLTSANVIASNIDTSKVGTYEITYRYNNSSGSVVKSFSVDVQAKSISNAKVVASDKTVTIDMAPDSEGTVLQTLQAQAWNGDGTGLVDGIRVLDYDGYNVSSPKIGKYKIVVAATGSDGVTVMTSAILTVEKEGTNTIDAMLYVTSPVYVQLNSKETSGDVVKKYITPHVGELANGQVIFYEPALTDITLDDGMYDNSKAGVYTFKLSTTAEKSGLELETLVKVVVGESVLENDAFLTIDGKDIAVLKDSTYNTSLASTLHANNFNSVTSILTTKDKTTTNALNASSIFYSNVDTSEDGTYLTTYITSDVTTGSYAIRSFKVEVGDFSASNAKIVATDAQVNLADAPKTSADLLKLLNANAIDASGTDLTSSITITELSNYNYTTPVVGKYAIRIQVLGSDGVYVNARAYLEVVDDSKSLDSIEMLVTTPVYVKKGSGETSSQVVDKYILPHIVETRGTTVNDAYLVKADSLDNLISAGYDNNQENTYYFILEETGKTTNLQVEIIVPVIVANSVPSDKTFATIDGKDLVLVQNSIYNSNNLLALHANNYSGVSAVLTNQSNTTNKLLTAQNIVSSNVDTSTVGNYLSTFNYTDTSKNIAATKSFNVRVSAPSITNAKITARDAQVLQTSAPTSISTLLEILQVQAIDGNGEDLTSQVKVVSLDDYDLSVPAVGKYLITVVVVGSDGVSVLKSITLEVLAASSKVDEIAMYVNKPVYIKLNSGESAVTVVDDYIMPHLQETVDDVKGSAYQVSSNEIITSVGGYKNDEARTYYFTLQATGQNGLTISRVVPVIVQASNDTIESYGVIDGQDIEVTLNAAYNDNYALMHHADKYQVVSAEVYQKGVLQTKSLTAQNLLSSNVDTGKKGEYFSTFFYQTNDLELVRSFKVTVSEVTKTNASIEATDVMLKLANAPKLSASIKQAIKVRAIDGDGSDLTSSVTIINLDDYDTSSPKVGTYKIGLEVVGKDGVKIYTSADLTIISNDSKVNAVTLYGNNPVFVTKGSGETEFQVIDNYIKPQIVETLAGKVQNAYQVSAIDFDYATYGAYDNNLAGTYYFVLRETGKQTDLVAEKIIEVIVSDTVPTDKTVVEIDGSSISVLRGSGYSKTLAPVLHANRYNYVSAEVTKGSNQITASLTSSNVLVTNVDTSVNNTYQTTFYYQDSASGAEAIKTFNVSVEDAKTSNANIAATDALVSLEAAPRTASEVLSTLKANAISTDGTDLTSAITIIDYDSYELAKPALGSYTITMEVLGKDGVKITTNAVLKVVENTSKKDRVELIVNNPVYIKQNDGTSALNVIDNYITPYISEVSEDILYDAYRIKSSSLDSSAFGGYDNSKLGTYYFVLAATGTKTKLQSEVIVTVIVSASGTDSLTIDGKDISVLKDSVYNNDLASKLHRNTYADVSAVWQIDPVSVTSLTSANVIASNIDTSKVGTYEITYRYNNSSGSVVKTFSVDVKAKSLSNAKVEATDAQVLKTNAPKTVASLISALTSKAIDGDGSDITQNIKVLDYGNYDLSDPQVGSYNIMLAVTGTNQVMVTTTAVLSVVSDDAKLNTIEMLTTSPVFVKLNSGESALQVIDKYIMPIVNETVGDDSYTKSLSATELTVDDGLYDNSKANTYYFVLKTVGSKTNLEVERIVKVVVSDTIPKDSSFITIDGKNLTILKNSTYTLTLVNRLHASSFDTVSAIVKTGESSKNVSLSTTNIVASDVDTSKEGVYQTIYTYAENRATATRALDVKVVSMAKTNAKLAATDVVLAKSKAPTTANDLLQALSVDAIDGDGSDLTSAVKIVDYANYNLTTPAIGRYEVLLQVTGSDNVTVYKQAVLTIVDDGSSIDKVLMLVNNPVYVKLNSGEDGKAVVDKYVLPHLIETIGSTNSTNGYLVKYDNLVSADFGMYDNKSEGTYYFTVTAKGSKTNLTVTKIVTVIVASNNSSVDAFATIDGKDITVLKGSAFSDDLASVLLANKYASVSSVITKKGSKTVKPLTSTNITYSNVDTSKEGSYTVIYSDFDQTLKIDAVKSFTVTVLDVANTNASIVATDAVVNLSSAPSDTTSLLNALKAKAIDNNGSDITSKITLVSLSGYNFTTPAVGEYAINLEVTGSDGVKVTTTAIIKVVADDEELSKIALLVTTPVYVKTNSGDSATQVIENYILPHLQETVNGKDEPLLSLSSSDIDYKSFDGYDNTKPGEYYFVLKETGAKTSLEVEQIVLVIVSDDLPTNNTFIDIDGQSIKIPKGSVYTIDNASRFHANSYDSVVASIMRLGDTSLVGLTKDNVISYNVDVTTVGTYKITYFYVDQASKSQVLKSFDINVVDKTSNNAKIAATDAQVLLANAPTSKASLVELLSASAVDGNGQRLDNQIKIVNYGDYNMSSPTVGTYKIVLSVTGNDGVSVTTTAMLDVLANDRVIDSIEMLVSTPVYVQLNSKESAKDVVDNYIKPHLIEVMDEVKSSAYLVNASDLIRLDAGGYDNSKANTYYFVLEAAGANWLQAEQIVKVIVSENPPTDDQVIKIDGKDIKVLLNSSYSNNLALKLHASKYQTVSADILQGSTSTTVALGSKNVISSDVSTDAIGLYSTTFQYTNSTTKETAIASFNVDVVSASKDNASLASNDAQVVLTNAPSSTSEVLQLFSANAIDGDGSDLTSEIVIVDSENYSYKTPAIGEYVFLLQATGKDGVSVFSNSTLKVVADTTANSQVKMSGNSPVYVTLNSKETADEVIDNYIKPYVFETVNDVDQIPYLVQATDLDYKSYGGYDNTKAGTYYFILEELGSKTSLEAETIIEVVVALKVPPTSTFIDIDAKDIKVLTNSTYLPNTMHANNYQTVAAIVQANNSTSNVNLDSSNIVYSNVNTSVNNTYNTVYEYGDGNGKAIKSLTVEVVSPSTTNAVVAATDVQIKQSDAPTSEPLLTKVLQAKAFDNDGSDLTNKIKVLDYDSYNVTTPQTGKYTITIAVTGSDGVMITTTAVLEVVEDSSKLDSTSMLVTTPVYVKTNSGDTATTVIDSYILPHLLETTANVKGNAYLITASSLDSYSIDGYDNSSEGSYFFKLVATGKNGLQVERIVEVIVANEVPSNREFITIDGKDITLLKGSAYNNTLASVLHANSYSSVSAVINGTTTKALSSSNVVSSNVNTSVNGTYQITYMYSTSNATASRTFNVTVQDALNTNAVVAATDVQIKQSDAPTSEALLIKTLQAKAFDNDGSDLTNKIKVLDYDSYNVTTPQTGKYTITIAVTGSDGVMVTTTAVLEVVEDSSKLDSTSMLVTTPVYIKTNSKETAATVIDSYILPHLLETTANVNSNAYLVTASTLDSYSIDGYDNSSEGSYFFKLVATGKNGLQVERIVEVVVANEVPSNRVFVTIDGKDIKVINGSVYNVNIAQTLHANKYSSVSAEVNSSVTALNSENIISSNVNPNVDGTYQTTYYYEDASGATATRTFQVVVAKVTNPTVISASDRVVDIADAPTTSQELLKLLNAKSFSASGVNISDKIKVVSTSGYDYTNPKVGTYIILLSATGDDNVTVYNSANLTVTAGTNKVSKRAKIHLSTPIYVELGNGMSASDVVDLMITPYVEEVIDETTVSLYSISANSLVTSSGYDNNLEGGYVFKFQTFGKATNLKIEQTAVVYVSANPNSVARYVDFDGQSIKVLENSYYSSDIAPKLHALNYDKVMAMVYTQNNTTPAMMKNVDVLESNVDTSKPSTYQTVFIAENGLTRSVVNSAEVVQPLNIEVVALNTPNTAVIEASDAVVNLASAPTNAQEILNVFNAKAIDGNGTKLFLNEKNIVDYGLYDVNNPSVGEYVITLALKGVNGVTVIEEVKLTIVSDDSSTNEIKMYLSNPVYVPLGNGMSASDVSQFLVMPFVVETVAGTNVPAKLLSVSDLVSSNGYDNNQAGTYIFKYQTVGEQTGLATTRYATVIVSDSPSSVELFATIDAKDITVIQDSIYNSDNALVLHANNNNVVTMSVNNLDNVYGPFNLTSENVIYSNVDTSKVGEYITIFYEQDSTNYESAIEVAKVVNVNVISANDATKYLTFEKQVQDTSGDNLADVAEVLSYQIAVTNTHSQLVFDNIYLYDELQDSNLSLSNVSNIQVIDSNNQIITDDALVNDSTMLKVLISKLAPGETITLKFDVKLGNKLSGKEISNSAKLVAKLFTKDSNRATIKVLDNKLPESGSQSISLMLLLLVILLLVGLRKRFNK